ncbi:MAG TPA: tRNA adenosine(34) deaminase TadA [Candidatus Kryptobacter bacterium]|nr:tRNA adenosine(34) deaminase TadA [Candidatus Kryptobacter bacterium]
MTGVENDHKRFMAIAFKEAEAAFEKNEIPVGAVIVKDGAVIAKAHNQVEMLQDPTAHAEIIAIGAAANHLGSWRLKGCTLYVTLEPCPMCAGAIVLSRMDRVVFGSYDPKMGACSTLYNVVQDERLNHRVEVIAGVMDDESRFLLREFFARKRS